MKSETIKVRIDRNGNVRRVVGNVGQTRMNKAANELWRGNIEPTFGYKLRRFLRRFGRACSRAIESATIYMEYNYHGEEPPLTAEEMHRLHVKPDDKVIVWGASRST